MKTTLTILITTLLALSQTGCLRSERSCTTNVDCFGGEVCEQGSCIPGSGGTDAGVDLGVEDTGPDVLNNPNDAGGSDAGDDRPDGTPCGENKVVCGGVCAECDGLFGQLDACNGTSCDATDECEDGFVGGTDTDGLFACFVAPTLGNVAPGGSPIEGDPSSIDLLVDPKQRLWVSYYDTRDSRVRVLRIGEGRPTVWTINGTGRYSNTSLAMRDGSPRLALFQDNDVILYEFGTDIDDWRELARRGVSDVASSNEVELFEFTSGTAIMLGENIQGQQLSGWRLNIYSYEDGALTNEPENLVAVPNGGTLGHVDALSDGTGAAVGFVSEGTAYFSYWLDSGASRGWLEGLDGEGSTTRAVPMGEVLVGGGFAMAEERSSGILGNYSFGQFGPTSSDASYLEDQLEYFEGTGIGTLGRTTVAADLTEVAITLHAKGLTTRDGLRGYGLVDETYALRFLLHQPNESWSLTEGSTGCTLDADTFGPVAAGPTHLFYVGADQDGELCIDAIEIP